MIIGTIVDGIVIDHIKAVLDFIDMHYTSTPSNFRISAIRI